MSTLADDLRAWRARTRVTQAEAACWLDVPLRTYQGWESGRAVERPRVLKLAMLALEKIPDCRKKALD